MLRHFLPSLATTPEDHDLCRRLREGANPDTLIELTTMLCLAASFRMDFRGSLRISAATCLMAAMVRFYAFGPPVWTTFRSFPSFRSFLTLKISLSDRPTVWQMAVTAFPRGGGPPPVGILPLPWSLQLPQENVNIY
jgi:hypothetical protein